VSKAPKATPISPPTERIQVNIRKISNGYIVCKSGVTRSGEYVSKETFSKTNPVRGTIK